MPREIGKVSYPPFSIFHANGFDIEWRIEAFFSLPDWDGARYHSAVFFFGGHKWLLEINPNGWSIRNSIGHIDLLLWRISFGPRTRQKFSFSLKTVKGKKYHSEHCSDVFVNCRYHEFIRFLPRSELSGRGSELMPDGVLTVICTMENMTFVALANKSFMPDDSKFYMHGSRRLYFSKHSTTSISKY